MLMAGKTTGTNTTFFTLRRNSTAACLMRCIHIDKAQTEKVRFPPKEENSTSIFYRRGAQKSDEMQSEPSD